MVNNVVVCKLPRIFILRLTCSTFIRGILSDILYVAAESCGIFMSDLYQNFSLPSKLGASRDSGCSKRIRHPRYGNANICRSVVIRRVALIRRPVSNRNAELPARMASGRPLYRVRSNDDDHADSDDDVECER